MPSSRSSSATSRSDPGSNAPSGAVDETPAIRLRGLETRFGDHVVFQNLDLDVRRGEVLGVVGGSGTGKSVLLRTIVGLNRSSAGRIEILGEETARLDAEARRRLDARFGVLFQDGALFSSLTVAQNIQVPLREHLDLSQDLLDGIAAMKIAVVGLPADAARKYPSELSGGMRKRAGLARALALDPELIFLDEPTAGLDPISAAEFDRLIANLQRSMRLTVFMVTHDIDSLKAITDRIAVLVDKRTRVGTMAELLRDEHPWIRAYFHGPRGRAAIPSAQGEA
jgi:phospholipid/cholesterol/gamma-HCH transport system ATP-binding protein